MRGRPHLVDAAGGMQENRIGRRRQPRGGGWSGDQPIVHLFRQVITKSAGGEQPVARNGVLLACNGESLCVKTRSKGFTRTQRRVSGNRRPGPSRHPGALDKSLGIEYLIIVPCADTPPVFSVGA